MEYLKQKKQKKQGRIALVPKKKKKAKRKVYFGMEVQNAIIRYNETPDESKKNKIYV